MITQNRKTSARHALAHPLLDIAEPPTEADCLKAIDRAAGLIELLNHLTTDRGLSVRAAVAHEKLSKMLQATLRYSSYRLRHLGRKRRDKAHQQTRYLSALARAQAILDGDDQDRVLDAVAAQLQIERPAVDSFVSRATRSEVS